MRNTIILPLIIALMSVANAKETLVLPHVGVNLLETKDFDNDRMYRKYKFFSLERERFLDHYERIGYIRTADTNLKLKISTAIVDEEDIPKVARVEVSIANYISDNLKMHQNDKNDLMTLNDYVRDIIKLNPNLNFKQVYESQWRSESLYSIKHVFDAITITYEGLKNGDLYVKNNPNKYLPKVGHFRVGESERADVLDWVRTTGCDHVKFFTERVRDANLLDVNQSCKYISNTGNLEIAGSVLGFPNETKVIFNFNYLNDKLEEVIVFGKADDDVVHSIKKAVVEKYLQKEYIRNQKGYYKPNSFKPELLMSISTVNDKRTERNTPNIELHVFKSEDTRLIKSTAENIVYKLSFKYEIPEDEETFIKNINPAAEALVRHKNELNKDLDKEAEKVKSLL